MCATLCYHAYMAGYRIKTDPHRYLKNRDGVYQYVRRVPTSVADKDSRAPIIRISLKTNDLARAMTKRHEKMLQTRARLKLLRLFASCL